MTKEKVIPQIRFSGFTDTWEQREFGDENDLITGYPFESDCFSETGINLIRGMNVKRGYIDLSNDICVKWTSSKGLESYLLKENDIIIQMDGALIGKSYGIIKKKHLPALLVQRVTRARINNEIADSDFMYQTIQRDFLTYISMNKTETAVPHLSLNDIKNFGIMVPTLLEQKMIGSFFANLDRLITLHQRKYDKLTKVKKAMLEKMFPENGSPYPEIRFKGFTDAWEQRKLGDIASDMVAGGDIDKDLILAEGQYPVIANALTGDGIVGYYDKEYRVNAPAVTVTGRGDVGHAKARLVNFTPVVRLLSVKSEHDVFFLENVINTLKIVIESTGVPQLTVPQLAKYEVAFPRQLDEEEHIGAFFKQLDHLITLHQRKLEKLKNIKKACLEKMFV